MAMNDARRGAVVRAAWLLPTLAFIVATGALGVTSKLALRTLAWQELVVWVGFAYVVVAVAVVCLGQAPLRIVAATRWAILSAALAICAIITLYLALGSGEVSTVVPVSAAYPAVTLVLSSLVLRERLSKGRIAGMLLVVAGVVLLTTAG